MYYLFGVSNCSISQAIAESNRLLFQILLVHITTCLINGSYNFFSEELFRSLLITAISIILYHLFIRKITEPYIEISKLSCLNKHERKDKKLKIDKKYDLDKNNSFNIYQKNYYNDGNIYTQ
jgi:hypothetical protein